MSDPEVCRDALLYGLGSHEYDALLFLLETEVAEVEAMGRRTSQSCCVTCRLRHPPCFVTVSTCRFPFR